MEWKVKEATPSLVLLLRSSSVNVEEFHLNVQVNIEPLTHIFEHSSNIVLAYAKFRNITKPNGQLNADLVTILTEGV
jgi:hypothetical protein